MGTRRDFIKKTGLGSTALALGGTLMPNAGFSNILGANDTLQVAVIGVRSRAKGLIAGIKNYTKAHIKYNCDVDDTILEAHNAWCEKEIGYVPKTEKDFRKILDDKDIDAVFIATPEHWHAPMAIMALQAGKHVYVEKPCSHNLHENELLVAAQKKYNKIVQMGNQQRSADTSIKAIKEIQEGIIGEVYKGEAYYSNNRGSIGIGKEVPVPTTLDWELWQGPAPRRAYKDNIHPYNWHWFRNWGTGEIHNNGTHEIDICRWALGVDIPETVTSFGGKYTYQDDWEFADNQQVTYTFEGNKTLTWTGHSRGVIMPKQPGRGVTIYGSKGIITLSRNSYEFYDLGGELIKQEFEREKSGTIDTVGGGGLTTNHIANFFDAIRIDTPLNAPISDASISTMLCHLGNLAQDMGETLTLEAKTRKINNEAKIKDKLSREYAKGWEPRL
ncbi:Gfo/Idh/MocA family oxidoreductase [Flavobacteriaceae bacterium 3-367]|uniref:Gfo/Idh/MocA family oxidoreductase n=1 Tax=Eudoraea algarum TaxID=3417568 RepID=UPI00327A415C